MRNRQAKQSRAIYQKTQTYHHRGQLWLHRRRLQRYYSDTPECENSIRSRREQHHYCQAVLWLPHHQGVSSLAKNQLYRQTKDSRESSSGYQQQQATRASSIFFSATTARVNRATIGHFLSTVTNRCRAHKVV